MDEKTRTVHVLANGREAKQDPYFAHLYRIGLDGKGYQSLTPADGHHAAQVSPSGKYFVLAESTPVRPADVVLRDAAGAVVMPLEKMTIGAMNGSPEPRNWRHRTLTPGFVEDSPDDRPRRPRERRSLSAKA